MLPLNPPCLFTGTGDFCLDSNRCGQANKCGGDWLVFYIKKLTLLTFRDIILIDSYAIIRRYS